VIKLAIGTIIIIIIKQQQHIYLLDSRKLTDYADYTGLYNRASGIRFPLDSKDYSFPHGVRIISGAHRNLPHPSVHGDMSFSLGVRRPERKADEPDHSPPTTVGVSNW